VNADSDSLRTVEEMLADPDDYFTHQYAIRQREAEAKRSAERAQVRITWAPLLALVALLVLVYLLGYLIGSLI
jgi:hypothetical protein